MPPLPHYLKRDLGLLVILIALFAGLIIGLWYLENTQGLFSQLAQQFLTF